MTQGSPQTACCAGRPLPRWAEASGFRRRKCFFFSFLCAIFLNFRKSDCPNCLLEAGLWNLALWAVFDLTCFPAMGYDFFPWGGEKWACRQGRRLREPGWAGTAQERRSACFSAAGCDWERCKGAWTAACAGMTPAGFLLAQEGHCGPLTRRCLGHRRPLPRWGEAGWTAAYAAVTRGAVQRSLDCRLRRKDTCWTAACAGRTLGPPHPAVPWAPPASPAVGRGVLAPSCMSFPRKRESSCFFLDCCLRRNDTKGHTQRSLDSCFRGDDTATPSP